MKLILESWYNFINEADPGYEQKEYPELKEAALYRIQAIVMKIFITQFKIVNMFY